MKFRLIEDYLVEDIEAVKKYYSDIPAVVFDDILITDPTYTQGNNNVGKYTKWMLNQYRKDNTQFWDGTDALNDITDALSVFDKKKNSFQNKDIGQFKTVEDLLNAVDDIVEVPLSHRQEVRLRQKDRKNADISKDAEKVFENENWVVYVPHTYAASCKLGQGTKWCTASTESSEKYDEYTEDDSPLFININKKTGQKYQFYFGSEETDMESQFMNADDNDIDLIQFFVTQGGEELFRFYRDWFASAYGGDAGETEQLEYAYDEYEDKVYIYPDDFSEEGLGEDLYYCRYLVQTIEVANTVKEISENAFDYCFALKDIYIPNSVEEMSGYTFVDCKGVIIHCTKGSYAEQYAKEWRFKYTTDYAQ